ncbi:uncharacterized protein LOC124168034 isoform X2 [Ischnura elegans]|uniref:uncharacterized protein LOC124168034 isoform X2 n=1 Tax=Ischnura elegans TaxID=197161 RepID=UPI001ED89345|nr:uncharacterized protein LOC124168034 isoform X2 [Ischnura elegans]
MCLLLLGGVGSSRSHAPLARTPMGSHPSHSALFHTHPRLFHPHREQPRWCTHAVPTPTSSSSLQQSARRVHRVFSCRLRRRTQVHAVTHRIKCPTTSPLRPSQLNYFVFRRGWRRCKEELDYPVRVFKMLTSGGLVVFILFQRKSRRQKCHLPTSQRSIWNAGEDYGAGGGSRIPF